jgi:hypothetical protein
LRETDHAIAVWQNGAVNPQDRLAVRQDFKAKHQAGNIVVDPLLVDAPFLFSV